MNVLILLLGLVAVGFSGPFNSIVVGKMNVSGLQAGGLRMTLAGMLVFALPVVWKHRAEIRQHRKKLFFGGVCLGAHFYFWTSAFEHTSLSSAVIFLCAQPLIALLATARLHHERPTRAAFLGLLLSVVGMVVLGQGDLRLSGSALLGDLMVVLAGFSIVAYQLICRGIMKTVNPFAFNASVWFTAGVLLLTASLLSGQFSLAPPVEEGWTLKEGGAALLGLVFVSTYVGHGAFNFVIPRLKLIVINIGILVEPVLSILLGVWMGLDHWPEKTRLLGALLILLGVALALISEGLQQGKTRQESTL